MKKVKEKEENERYWCIKPSKLINCIILTKNNLTAFILNLGSILTAHQAVIHSYSFWAKNVVFCIFDVD